MSSWYPQHGGAAPMPLLPYPTHAAAATGSPAAPAPHKRAHDGADAGGSKYPRHDDASGGHRGRGGRDGDRRGGRGGSRGGRRDRDMAQAQEPGDATAAAASSAAPSAFLPGAHGPDLSMYLTPAGAASPAQARVAEASSATSDATAAAATAASNAPARPVYCQSFMNNLCPLRSCDAKDDDGPGQGQRARCEFVHDDEFRRTYLARAQFRATNWAQNRKDTGRGPAVRDEAPGTDGRLPGLKAPVKESALLRKLLSSELRVESSRVLQAIRYLVTHQCLAPQRERIRQAQQQAEDEYRRSKSSERDEQTAAQRGEEQREAQTNGDGKLASAHKTRDAQSTDASAAAPSPPATALASFPASALV